MNQQATLTPAALYARVSSDRQDVDLSVAAQLRALRDYAEKNGYVVAREYIDEAESGRIADRPQFRRMLDEAGKPEAPFQEILVWKFSRFTRKREHAVAFKSMLRKRGIRVTSITEHADDSPTGKLMEAIIESPWTSSTQRKSCGGSSGGECGRPPPEVSGFPPTPPSATVKSRCKTGPRSARSWNWTLPPTVWSAASSSWHCKETSTLDITKTLNREGLARSTTGPLDQDHHPPHPHQRDLHRNIGLGYTRAKDNAPPVRVEDAFPAIVSRDEFERVIRHPGVQGTEQNSPPPRCQPLPAQRHRQVRDLRQGPYRPRGQERPVHLLRLPLPAEAGTGRLRHPPAQCQAVRADDHRKHPGEYPHREQHSGTGEAGQRGVGQRNHRSSGRRWRPSRRN